MPEQRGLAQPPLSASLACRARLEPLFPCQDLTLPPASRLEKFRGLRQVLPARDWNILTTWRVQLPQLSLHACVCSAWNKGFQSFWGINHFLLATVVCPISELDLSSDKTVQIKGHAAACGAPPQDFSRVESSFATWSARFSLNRQQNAAQSSTRFAS